jgi:hypothetical protein
MAISASRGSIVYLLSPEWQFISQRISAIITYLAVQLQNY